MEEIFRNSVLSSTPSTSTSNSSSIPPMPSLISRLDRLDFLMKNLEGKNETEGRRRKWRSSGEIGPMEKHEVEKGELVPLEWAVKEAQSKGSVLDRITSLEYRLVQLFLSMESEGAASSSVSSQKEQTSAEIKTFSPRVAKKDEFSNSFSIFRTSNSKHPNRQSPENYTDKFQTRGDSNKGHHHQITKHNEESPQRPIRKAEERGSPKLKKVGLSRLHLRLLGC